MTIHFYCTGTYVRIWYNTFVCTITTHDTILIENTNNFSKFGSYNNGRSNYYISKTGVSIYLDKFIGSGHNLPRLVLGILKNGSGFIRSKEERIKILAEELLFQKRRNQLTKIVRAYKEKRRQKIISATENYIPVDLGKIIESYVQKIEPIIDCRFNKTSILQIEK